MCASRKALYTKPERRNESEGPLSPFAGVWETEVGSRPSPGSGALPARLGFSSPPSSEAEMCSKRGGARAYTLGPERW